MADTDRSGRSGVRAGYGFVDRRGVAPWWPDLRRQRGDHGGQSVRAAHAAPNPNANSGPDQHTEPITDNHDASKQPPGQVHHNDGVSLRRPVDDQQRQRYDGPDGRGDQHSNCGSPPVINAMGNQPDAR
ncbi:hypothetical protein GCM10010174_07500 [Kutzneria viridogrisea]